MLAAHPMCARTGTEWWWDGDPEPCAELATEDDHVVAIGLGGDLHDPSNHQGLCSDCHSTKSTRERELVRPQPDHDHVRRSVES